MKINLKIFTTLLLIISSIFVINGQTIVLYGYVKGLTNNTGIPNHQVIIHSQIDTATSTGMNYYSSVFTANNGFFVDSVTIPTGQNIKFNISTLDCNNNLVVDSFYSLNPTQINLQICDSGLISCKADYLTYADTANHKKVYFVNMTIPSNAYSLWNFGDGDSTDTKNPIHTYTNDGSYVVTLSIWDTINPCFSQKIDTINVSPVLYCTNTFTYSSTFLTATFSGTVNNSLPTVYKWDFGDFSTATGQNPTHIYAHAGIFKVILQTISVNPLSMDTCISTTFKHITIQSPPVGNIWGQVFADTGMVRNADVILYRLSSQSNNYYALDTVDITVIDSLNLSYYYFANVPFGKYLTKARLKNNSPLYQYYGPAYFGNGFKWNKSAPFDHNQGGNNKPIHLTHIFPAIGTVQLEGYVLEGNFKNPGDPVSGVLIYLYDVQGDVYGVTYSDQHGYYSFSNLKYEKYYIHAEIVNKEMIASWVWPNEGSPLLKDINIYIGEETITSISNMNNVNAKVYPNPASNSVNVLLDVQTNSDYSFSVYNSVGQLVQFRSETLSPNNNKLNLDISNLTKGLYTLKIQTENQSPSSFKIIVL